MSSPRRVRMKNDKRIEYRDIKQDDTFSARSTTLPKMKHTGKGSANGLPANTSLPKGTAKNLRLGTQQAVARLSLDAVRALPEQSRVAAVQSELEQILASRKPGQDWVSEARALLALLSQAQQGAVMFKLLGGRYGDVLRANAVLPARQLTQLDELGQHFETWGSGYARQYPFGISPGMIGIQAHTGLLALLAYPGLQSEEVRKILGQPGFIQAIAPLRDCLFEDASADRPVFSGAEKEFCLDYLAGNRKKLKTEAEALAGALIRFCNSPRGARDVEDAIDKGLSFVHLEDFGKLGDELDGTAISYAHTTALHCLARHAFAPPAVSTHWDQYIANLKRTLSEIARGEADFDSSDLACAASPLERLLIEAANEFPSELDSQDRKAALENLSGKLEQLMKQGLEGDAEQELLPAGDFRRHQLLEEYTAVTETLEALLAST